MPGAYCGRKAGHLSEITLDRLDLFVSETEKLHVPERFAVLRMAKVFDEALVAVSDHLLQIDPFDEVDVRLPAACFEGTLADVVVVVRAREGKVVGQHG